MWTFRLNNSTLLIRFINSNSLRLFILWQYFIFRFQNIIINQLNLHCFRMSQKALTKVQNVSRIDSNLRNNTFSLDRHSKHILSYTFKVNNQNHIVVLWAARYELNSDLLALPLFKPTSVVLNVELALKLS